MFECACRSSSLALLRSRPVRDEGPFACRIVGASDSGERRSTAMTEFTRRRLLQYGAGAGAGLVVWRFGPTGRAVAAPIPGGTLDPTSIPKYVTPLVIPPAMPRTSKLPQQGGKSVDYYEIAVRQFQQHILPHSMGVRPTTVWSYGSVTYPGTFN